MRALPAASRLAAAWLCLAAPAAGAAAPPLTLDEALRRAGAHPALIATTDPSPAPPRPATLARTGWPDAEVAWAREHLPAADEAEDALSVAQTVPLSRRRARLRAAGEAEARAARHRADARALALGAEVRARFHDALHAQALVEAGEAWVAAQEEALAAVQARRGAGEASAWDLQRVAREVAVARADLDEARAARLAAWERLQALLPEPAADAPWPRVAGELLPPAPPAPEDASRAASEAPARAAEAALVEAAARDADAARLARAPSLGLAAGYRRVSPGPDVHHGYLVGLSLSVPWSGAAAAEADRARAFAGREAAEASRLAEREARDAAALAREVAARREAAASFLAGHRGRATALLDAARAAYRGGEARLSELLETQRAVHDDAVRALRMAREARRADDALWLATGGAR